MDELEKVAKKYLNGLPTSEIMHGPFYESDIMHAFIKGVEWERKQNKKNAIPAQVVREQHDSTGIHGNIMSDFINLEKHGLRFNDIIKILILED